MKYFGELIAFVVGADIVIGIIFDIIYINQLLIKRLNAKPDDIIEEIAKENAWEERRIEHGYLDFNKYKFHTSHGSIFVFTV